MKRPIRVLLLVLLAVIIAVAAAACGDTGGEEENPQSGTEYTVTFDSNGGSAVAAVKVRDGKKIAAPTAPTKAGYTFGGWCKESGLNNLWN
ncbi:MAG: InlB B-repeat-containing protein, partial [Clostridiales bacterium]|nr:InlB B-repeat-containing protein [Clostridiales bacterium]